MSNGFMVAQAALPERQPLWVSQSLWGAGMQNNFLCPEELQGRRKLCGKGCSGWTQGGGTSVETNFTSSLVLGTIWTPWSLDAALGNGAEGPRAPETQFLWKVGTNHEWETAIYADVHRLSLHLLCISYVCLLCPRKQWKVEKSVKSVICFLYLKASYWIQWGLR